MSGDEEKIVRLPVILGECLCLPVSDYLKGVDACIGRVNAGRIGLVVASMVLCWWVYVPVHELGHAFGCILAGGEVTRLEIDAVYGAAALKTLFPFVAVGSEYAGQLTGFDTRGSDLTYLATDFFPFLLTIFIGVPLLRSVASDVTGQAKVCIKLGASLPLAYAPFISLTGDYYEMGSIIVSRLAMNANLGVDVVRWRSDDLFRVVAAVFWGPGAITTADLVGVALSFGLGIALALVTYWLGAMCYDATGWGRGAWMRQWK